MSDIKSNADEATDENMTPAPLDDLGDAGINKPFQGIAKIVYDTPKSQSGQITGVHASSEEEKKRRFDNFLTARKRRTRVSLVQALYQYDINYCVAVDSGEVVDDGHKVNEANELYRSIIFFYKKVFFPNKYGTSKKTNKLDEKFLKFAINGFLDNREEIDSYIKRHIKPGWTISRLNPVLKAILRAAIFEGLYNLTVEHKIILSEYTNLASGCLSKIEEVNFVNAVLDKIIKLIRKL